MNDSALQAQATMLIRVLCKAYNKKYKLNIDNIDVTFDQEHTKPKYAGSATGMRMIQLNMTLFRDNVAEFFNVVIPHEVAHIAQVAYEQAHGVSDNYVKKGHGWLWVKMMEGMRQEPEQFHSMDTSKAKAVYEAHKSAQRKLRRALRRARKTDTDTIEI